MSSFFIEKTLSLPARRCFMYPDCHLRDHYGCCNLATLAASLPVIPSPEDCTLCKKADSKQAHQGHGGMNDVVRSLAVEANPNLHSHLFGTGSRLASLIEWFVSRPPNCSCGDRVEIMNMWGPKGCADNRATILSWLRESALDNGLPYSEFVIGRIVDVVIKASQRDYPQRPPQTPPPGKRASA